MLLLPERSTIHVADTQQVELDAIVRNEQLIRDAKHAERKRSYLQPGAKDVARQQGWVEARGYRLQTNQEGTEVIDIHWPTPEQEAADYRVFAKVCDLLWQRQRQSDAQFHAQPKYRHQAGHALSVFQTIEELLMGDGVTKTGMPFFRRLNDPTIPVSPSHKGIAPATHSLKVLELIKTDHIASPVRKFIIRTNAIFHDMGKLFIADKDEFQDHAHISYYIARKFLARYFSERFNFSLEEAYIQAEHFALPIRYHHLLEQVEENFLTEKEAAGLLPSDITLEEVATLTIADRLSIQSGTGKHTVFAFMVFFGYPHLLQQIVTTDKVELLTERLRDHCMAGVAQVAQEIEHFPDLLEQLAIPVINGVMKFNTTQEGLLSMLALGALGTTENHQANKGTDRVLREASI